MPAIKNPMIMEDLLKYLDEEGAKSLLFLRILLSDFKKEVPKLKRFSKVCDLIDKNLANKKLDAADFIILDFPMDFRKLLKDLHSILKEIMGCA
jgi:hypothetical protein